MFKEFEVTYFLFFITVHLNMYFRLLCYSWNLVFIWVLLACTALMTFFRIAWERSTIVRLSGNRHNRVNGDKYHYIFVKISIVNCMIRINSQTNLELKFVHGAFGLIRYVYTASKYRRIVINQTSITRKTWQLNFFFLFLLTFL